MNDKPKAGDWIACDPTTRDVVAVANSLKELAETVGERNVVFYKVPPEGIIVPTAFHVPTPAQDVKNMYNDPMIRKTARISAAAALSDAQDGDKREWEEEFDAIIAKDILVSATDCILLDWFHHPSLRDTGAELDPDKVKMFIRSIESRTAERTLAEAREVVEEKVSEMITTLHDLYRESVVDDANKANEESYSMAVVRQVGDDIARALAKK